MLTVPAIGGIVFLFVAVVGGVGATISNMRSAKGPKERVFVRFNCIAAWGVAVLCLALMYYLPSPWRYLVLIPYFFHLPVAIYRATMKRQLIRRLEHMESVRE
ncbi:MAG: hypothetical protein BWY59_01546 [Verrucomicrobia bacterium ADurb.Bin345]|nr:MAG: hypothetical protein BWY59_01546 [Verrucomicrobia bacterium ADurb.Bin345]